LPGIILMLAACTKTPATITAAHVSEASYADLTCEQLAAERLSIASMLAATGEATSRVKTCGKVSVAGIDQKRAVEAITLAMNKKECRKASQPIFASVAQQPAARPVKVTR
jgi:putative component of membrane protein insertase Oxa1/YidC/SpoIIIJ protein YidD